MKIQEKWIQKFDSPIFESIQVKFHVVLVKRVLYIYCNKIGLYKNCINSLRVVVLLNSFRLSSEIKLDAKFPFNVTYTILVVVLYLCRYVNKLFIVTMNCVCVCQQQWKIVTMIATKWVSFYSLFQKFDIEWLENFQFVHFYMYYLFTPSAHSS